MSFVLIMRVRFSTFCPFCDFRGFRDILSEETIEIGHGVFALAASVKFEALQAQDAASLASYTEKMIDLQAKHVVSSESFS